MFALVNSVDDMKYTAYIYLLFTCLLLNSCSKNDGSKLFERSVSIAWIEDTMRKNYYWYKEIPEADKLVYTMEETAFFSTLLSNKDGKDYYSGSEKNHYFYSTINKAQDASLPNTRATGASTLMYGFEFFYIYNSTSRTEIQALVQYIIKDSPAAESGLKRGDWITQINDKAITTADMDILQSGGGISLTVERWSSDQRRFVTHPEKIYVPAARMVTDNPVYKAEVITSSETGKKVGYLVYNHFTAGVNTNDETYDNELRRLSGTVFDGVNEFVLDLRYNNGGSLSSALVLCAMLAPQSALEKPFCYLQFNDKHSPREEEYKAGSKQLIPNGKNLNISTLYVLTSYETASASEMIINSLRPYMNVVVIGEQTEGKNVGSRLYTSSDKKWEMHPIVCQISNSEKYSDYANGFSPDYELYEAFIPTVANPNQVIPVEVHELGDKNERLLNVALNLIDGIIVNIRSNLILEDAPTFPITRYNSIDRKATLLMIN